MHFYLALEVLEPYSHSGCAELSANAPSLRLSQSGLFVHKRVRTQVNQSPNLLASRMFKDLLKRSISPGVLGISLMSVWLGKAGVFQLESSQGSPAKVGANLGASRSKAIL